MALLHSEAEEGKTWMNSLSREDNEALRSRNRERQMQPSAEAELLPVVERKY